MVVVKEVFHVDPLHLQACLQHPAGREQFGQKPVPGVHGPAGPGAGQRLFLVGKNYGMCIFNSFSELLNQFMGTVIDFGQTQ